MSIDDLLHRLHGMAPNFNILNCNHWYQSPGQEGMMGESEEGTHPKSCPSLSFDLY